MGTFFNQTWLRGLSVLLLLLLAKSAPAQPQELQTVTLEVSSRVQIRSTFFEPEGRGSSDLAERSFELERGRLDFTSTIPATGTGGYLNLDLDTDDEHQVIGHDYWLQQELFSDTTLFVGKAFVPGSREWIDGSTGTQLIDRSLATTFFRPDRSLGTWVIGEFSDTHYRAMIADGFDSNDFDEARRTSDLAYAVSMWRYLGEPYGDTRTDFDYHTSPAVRYGTSFTTARIHPREKYAGSTVTLSNGLSIKDILPGTGGDRIRRTDLHLLAADMGIQWRGISLHLEAYVRRLANNTTLLGNKLENIDDFGVAADAGVLLIPLSLEFVLRHSRIDGRFRTSQEYMAGLSWFLDGSHSNKLAVDFGTVRNFAADNSGPNFTPGQHGFMTRILLQLSL